MTYPPALELEYRALMHRKYTVGLDAAAQGRFRALKDEFSAIDMADPAVQRGLARMKEYTAALKRLSREVQSAIAEATK